MGDPRKQRKKYSKPMHPWRMDRITEEKELMKKYGLKNKREIWRAKSMLRRFRQQARTLLGLSGPEADKQAKELTSRLKSLGVLKTDNMEDILALTVSDLLDRRLQTVVYNKGLVNTIKEARQLVVHKHVMVGEHMVSVPSYKVKKSEEDLIKLKGVKVKEVDEGKAGEVETEKAAA
jgi:small subunit ribosomal protein S4